MLENITDPKQTHGKPAWYRYYAGYSPDFVDDVIKSLPPESRLLDPWMGAGTTLSAASKVGLRSAGVDLSPAMLVVARGRLLSAVGASEALEVVKSMRFRSPDRLSVLTDPLTHWFDSPTAAVVRGIARWIDDKYSSGAPHPSQRADSLTPSGAFCYVALFTAVKKLTRDMASKNPSWTKRTKLGTGIVSVPRDSVVKEFLAAMTRLQEFSSEHATGDDHSVPAGTLRADSRRLPFGDNSYDAVLTSPPYCTRLDYVIAQSPELTTLGLTDEDLRSLRDEMIGTPTMGHKVSPTSIGDPAQRFIDAVAHHKSYASASYYAPNFRRYFDGMAQSFSQLNRVTSPGGKIVLVVQDSRFKDVHLDLAACMVGMGADLGWSLSERRDFTAVRSMGSVNQQTSSATRSTMPVESVLAFTTPAAPLDARINSKKFFGRARQLLTRASEDPRARPAGE